MSTSAVTCTRTDQVFAFEENHTDEGYFHGYGQSHLRMEKQNEKPPVDMCQKRVSMQLQAGNVLSELRQCGQFCDAILKAEGKDFPVHRAIMSACSPYLRALFTNGLYETQQKIQELPEISAQLMEVVIEYAYSREAKVTSENVQELLPVADHLGILGLVKACCDFLKASITFENCIGIRNLARNYFCTQLEKDTTKFILGYFLDVAEKSTEILQLSCDDLRELLDHEELNVKSEEHVFDMVLRWINYDSSNRKKYIYPLLKCIRLGLLSSSYFVEKVRFEILWILLTDLTLVQVKAHPYVCGSDDCWPLYDLDLSKEKEVDSSNPIARPRVPHEILFAIGGWSRGSPTSEMEAYDTRADRWVQCAWGDPNGICCTELLIVSPTVTLFLQAPELITAQLLWKA